LFQALKRDHVIKIGGGIRFNFFYEGAHAGFVHEWQLHGSVFDYDIVKLENKLHFEDVLFTVIFITLPRVLGPLKVFIHFYTHVLSVPNAVGFDPKFHLFETFSSPNSAN